MATVARPVGPRRPNLPSANIQLPAVNTYTQVNDEVIDTLRPTKAWFGALLVAIACLLVGATAWMYQIYTGLGVTGLNPPVMWGVYIVTFVFWIGIGHAGTLISAILYLFRAGFRTTIYRCTEAMTVFAVMTAGLFPILHLGRPWKFFYLIPYPNWRLIWPQFKSPLVWDVFAILTYLTVSTTFLYLGLVPDIAALRDRETNPIRKRIFSQLSLGWRNSDREWRHFARAYLFLAAFSTPLVLSVHSVVSFDFAMANTPGWHTTIFPPYFVAGAIFSGIGMVFTIIIPLRRWFGLKHYVTINHLDAAAKLCLFTSVVVGCAYLTEFWIAWYSGNEPEQAFWVNRVFGQWWWAAWIMLTCNCILPLSLFIQKWRRNTTWLFTLSLFINLGMWFERFVIFVASLSHEFEPWQWTAYRPSLIDWSILLGSFGWFFMWFLLFVKNLPIVAIAEVKEMVPPRLRMVHHEHDVEHGIDLSARHFDYEPETPGEQDLMRGIIGVFRELDATCEAIDALKKARVGDITVYTPAPRHELEHALEHGPSPVRRYTLVGGLAGATFGWWISIWASDYWPLVVGGKPIASWVPYTVFGFEVMVLIGSLATVAGLFISARFPRITMTVGYDPRFSDGSYGVWVECRPDEQRSVHDTLQQFGAVEVRGES